MKPSKINIIYHNKDLDGFCSGAIAHKAMLFDGHKPENIEMIGWNYGDLIPLQVTDKILDPMDLTYMLDLSFPDEEMIRLCKNPNFAWIDHHAPAIEKAKELGLNPPGVRKDGDSASLLAWKFFFSLLEVPDVVYYVDRYDVFKDHDRNDWQTILAAQHGMRMQLGDPSDSNNLMEWTHLLGGDNITRMIKDGAVILKGIERENKLIAKAAWPVKLGDKTIAMINYHRPDSDISKHIRFDHDGLAFMQYREDSVVFSFRKLDHHTADLQAIAIEMGGGGHKNACGFKIDLGEEDRLLDLEDVMIYAREN